MCRPSPYSNTDSAEVDAINVFRSLVNTRSVKLDIKERDKYPNTDGTAELVDEQGVPLGKAEIQVRKLPKDHTWYDCPRELFAYSKIATVPVLLVCVDVEAKIAFWRHISTSLTEFKPAQKTSRLKFDPLVAAIGPNTTYITQWQEVITDYQSRITEYPILKKRIDEEIGLASIDKPDIIYFQTFIEKVNQLLDIDFEAVKQLRFADVWKLGVGIQSAKPDRINYQIYAIQKGANAPLISSFVDKPPEGFLDPAKANGISAWISEGGSTLQMSSVNRSSLKDAETEARNFALKDVKKMLEQRRFQIVGMFLSREYIFWFLDRYHHCVGLPMSDSYKVAAINYAVRVFLPAWYYLAQRRYLEINKNSIPIGIFPSFENIAGMCPATERPTNEQVEALLKTGSRIPPTYISTQFFLLRSVLQGIDYLLDSGEQTVKRLYRPRTRSQRWIWDGYTTEDRRYNIESILSNAVHEYRLFVIANSFHRLESQFLSDVNALVYVGEISNMGIGEKGPSLETYIVENRDRKLSKVTFVEKSSRRVTAEGEKLSIDGLERKILHVNNSVATHLFRDFPMLLVVYDMLKKDLVRQYGLR